MKNYTAEELNQLWCIDSVLLRVLSRQMDYIRVYFKPYEEQQKEAYQLFESGEYEAWYSALEGALTVLLAGVHDVDQGMAVLDVLEEAWEALMLHLEEEVGPHLPETDPWEEIRKTSPEHSQTQPSSDQSEPASGLHPDG